MTILSTDGIYKNKELMRKINFGLACLLPVITCLFFTSCIALLMSSCNAIDEDEHNTDNCQSNCELALRLATGHGVLSRTADDVAQTNGVFRGIQDLWLLPFIESSPVSSSKPLIIFDTESIENSELLAQSKAHLFRAIKVPTGTKSFVVYGRAKEQLSGVASERENEKFHYGVLVDNLSTAISKDNEIGQCQFSLEPIAAQTETVGSRLAAYLSNIAQTPGWSSAAAGPMLTLYNAMINTQAGSSRCVKAMIQSLYFNLHENLKTSSKYDEMLERAVISRILTTGFATDTDDDGILTFDSSLDGYPANRNLPDGAALLTFDNETKTFTDCQGAIANSVYVEAVYAYPAGLYYHVNSSVLVSEEEQSANYNGSTTWDEILSEYHAGSVQVSTQSVAIASPLQYAVAQLEVSLKLASQNLLTANGSYFNTGSGLPVSAVFVGGQMPVDWAFHGLHDPTSAVTIYDREVSGIATVSGSDCTHTLVLETYPKDPVYVCVELENNTAIDFQGFDGVVAAGCRFYMVGQLDASDELYSSHDYRVFSQDMTTHVVFTINDLKKAYVNIPDLRSPQLQLGLTANLEWQSGISKDKTI